MEEYKFGKELQELALSGKGSQQICNQLLFEDAVWFFMNNHQMDEMIGDCENLKRQTGMIHRGFDFESKELCIEIKVFIQQSNRDKGSLWRRFWQSIEQVIRYVTDSSDWDAEDKRIILFMVGRSGISEEIKKLIGKGNGRLLKKATGMGMELWVAEMELKLPDGIKLLSYKNITNDILDLK